ncbi:MAG: hypothetical protein COT85_07880 [Chlamydiae bacterium CG10_big_fil_rev_8_21_14_0_10_42_34]|nr:MAG: hypothetical protein COT85_07880 [Chlamydiae bacterium CG10_big_fil_rev_8_21_14_0_10_42_34]
MNHKLADTQQSFWQLTAIQLSGWMSLPILATSILVLQQNSFLGAALTIFVGNAILWFLRLGIISMSHNKRQSTLDLAHEYFGKAGSYFIASLLLISTLVWFLIQTTAASNALTHLITLNESPKIDQFVQVCVLIGLASTFLCMEGIVLLRRLSMIAFPILLVTFAVIFLYNFGGSHTNQNALSLSGLSLVLATNLGITADMPTFFRHSNSWNDSIKALTATQVISLILGLASLYLGSLINGMFEINQSLLLQSDHEILRTAMIIFIFVSAVTANVANVYSASVGWEIIAPKALIGRQEYLILGLGLTMFYILFANVFSPDAVLSLSDNALVNLSLVLIFAYVLSKTQKHPHTLHQKATYFIAWATATSLNAIQQLYSPFPALSPLFVTLCSILLVLALSYGLSRLRKRSY